MIKAVAILTESGKSTVLLAGTAGDCIKAARKAGESLNVEDDNWVQVFSSAGCVYNDNGRKADYQRRLDESENATKASDSALDSALDSSEPESAKKVAKKVAKKTANKSSY